MGLQPDVTPNSSNPAPDEAKPRARASNKSPIVTRRRALAMAFHRAVASLGGAKDKAASGIIDAVAHVKKAANTPKPPGEL